MEQELMDILTDLRPDVDFETETALIDDHILESFDIVSLVAALNDAFDIESAQRISCRTSNSAKSLLAMVQRLQGRGLMDKTALKTAAAASTPLYLFDLDAFTARAEKVRAAFNSHVQLCYSMKANPLCCAACRTSRWVECCSPGRLTICESSASRPSASSTPA